MNKDEVLTKSLDEFMEFYKITDNEKIYSNGIDYVPIFRVKQWEEYNNKDKEIERLHSIIKEVREYVEELLKEEIEVTDIDNANYGEMCQRAYFSDSELGKVLEILDKERGTNEKRRFRI